MIGNLVEKLLNGSKTFVFDPFWSPKIGSSKNQQVFMPKSTIFPGIIRDRVLNHLRSSDRHKKKTPILHQTVLHIFLHKNTVKFLRFPWRIVEAKLTNSKKPDFQNESWTKNEFHMSIYMFLPSTSGLSVCCFGTFRLTSFFRCVWRKWIRKNLWDKTNKHWEFASDYP